MITLTVVLPAPLADEGVTLRGVLPDQHLRHPFQHAHHPATLMLPRLPVSRHRRTNAFKPGAWNSVTRSRGVPLLGRPSLRGARGTLVVNNGVKRARGMRPGRPPISEPA